MAASIDAVPCAYCGATPVRLLKCGGCRIVKYCNVICQKAHWKTHKLTCKDYSASSTKKHEETPPITPREASPPKGEATSVGNDEEEGGHHRQRPWDESPDEEEKSPPRFPLGTRVECCMGPTWALGKVIKHGYQEEGMSYMASYQVQLDDGSLIYAPDDLDTTIRLAPASAPPPPVSSSSSSSVPRLRSDGGKAGAGGIPEVFRFPLGTRVDCRMQGLGWVPGRIIQHGGCQLYTSVAYQVRLDDGSVISAPFDDDKTVRLAPKPGPAGKPVKRCGLCGETRGKFIRTKCCGKWVCDNNAIEGQYTTAANCEREGQCARNHRYGSICGFHHAEGHGGPWKECKKCEAFFHPFDYAVKASSMALSGTERRYNFDDNVRIDLPMMPHPTRTTATASTSTTIPWPKCDKCGAKVDTTEETTKTLVLRKLAGQPPLCEKHGGGLGVVHNNNTNNNGNNTNGNNHASSSSPPSSSSLSSSSSSSSGHCKKKSGGGDPASSTTTSSSSSSSSGL